MKILLDTSVLLWWLAGSPKLRPAVMAELCREETIGLFSQVSLLEIQIKAEIGKLHLDFPVQQIPALAVDSGLTPLALSNAAIYTLPKLPRLHEDPFDRLLICEAIQEGATLATPDRTIQRYPVKILWE